MSLSSKLVDFITVLGTDIKNLLTNKQDKLESGTNIKTINGVSILGAGDLEITLGDATRLFSSSTPPVDANVDDLWFNDVEGDLSVYYGNNGNPVWVTIISKSTPPSSGNSVALVDGGTASPRIPSVIINGGTA